MKALESHALVAVLLIAIVVPKASAQSQFLDRGTSGLFVGGSFASNEFASGIDGGVAFSVNGVVDLGLSVGRVSNDGVDLNAIAVIPFVRAYLLKADENIPVNLSVSAGYERDSWSGQELDALGWDMSSSALSFGGGVSVRAQPSNNVDLYPGVSFSYSSVNATIGDSFGAEASSSDTATYLTLGMAAALRPAGTHILSITPSVTMGNDTTTFGFGIGAVFPFAAR